MWTPHEVRKLIAQISGVIFGVAGVILIIKDIKASGHINISSKVLSGQMESGSAGLFILFMSFLLILIPAIFTRNSTASAIESTNKTMINTEFSDVKRMAIGTAISITLTLLLIFGGDYLENQLHVNAGALLVMGGIMSGMVSAAMFVGFLITFVEKGSAIKSEEKAND